MQCPVVMQRTKVRSIRNESFWLLESPAPAGITPSVIFDRFGALSSPSRHKQGALPSSAVTLGERRVDPPSYPQIGAGVIGA